MFSTSAAHCERKTVHRFEVFVNQGMQITAPKWTYRKAWINEASIFIIYSPTCWMESRVRFCCPQNISGSILLNNWRRWGLVFKMYIQLVQRNPTSRTDRASGDVDYAGWTVRSHLINLKQIPISISCLGDDLFDSRCDEQVKCQHGKLQILWQQCYLAIFRWLSSLQIPPQSSKSTL